MKPIKHKTDTGTGNKAHRAGPKAEKIVHYSPEIKRTPIKNLTERESPGGVSRNK